MPTIEKSTDLDMEDDAEETAYHKDALIKDLQDKAIIIMKYLRAKDMIDDENKALEESHQHSHSPKNFWEGELERVQKKPLYDLSKEDVMKANEYLREQNEKLKAIWKHNSKRSVEIFFENKSLKTKLIERQERISELEAINRQLFREIQTEKCRKVRALERISELESGVKYLKTVRDYLNERIETLECDAEDSVRQ